MHTYEQHTKHRSHAPVCTQAGNTQQTQAHPRTHAGHTQHNAQMPTYSHTLTTHTCKPTHTCWQHILRHTCKPAHTRWHHTTQHTHANQRTHARNTQRNTHMRQDWHLKCIIVAGEIMGFVIIFVNSPNKSIYWPQSQRVCQIPNLVTRFGIL